MTRTKYVVAIANDSHLCLLPNLNFKSRISDESDQSIEIKVPAINLQSLPFFLSEFDFTEFFFGQTDPHSFEDSFMQKKTGCVRNSEDKVYETSHLIEDIPLRLKRSLDSTGSSQWHYDTLLQYTQGRLQDKFDNKVYVNDYDVLCVYTSLNDQSLRKRVPSSDFLQCNTSLVCPKSGKVLTRIHNNNTGYFINDFYGINGWEQILFLPALDHDVHIEDTDESMFLEKNYFQDILLHSIMISGFNALLFAKGGARIYSSKKYCVPTNKHCISHIHIPQIQLVPVKKKDYRKISSRQRRKRKNTNYDRGTKNTKSVMTKLDNIQAKQWEQKINDRHERQLKDMMRLKRQTESFRKIKKKIVQVSQDFLQDRLYTHDNKHDTHVLKLAGLRSETEFRTNGIEFLSSSNQNSMSFSMRFEVDMYLPARNNKHWLSNDEDHHHSSTIVGSNVQGICHGLQNLHLTCSPVLGNDQNLIVKSQSGLIPLLSHGNCVTIIMSVQLSGIKVLDTEPKSTDLDLFLRININASWNVFNSEMQSQKFIRKGMVLGILNIPFESIMSFSTERNILKEHFSSVHSSIGSHPIPAAIFECRHFRTINIDLSQSSTGDSFRQLKNLARSLNKQSFISGNRVDTVLDKKSMIAAFTVFGISPEQRLGMLIDEAFTVLPYNLFAVFS